MQLLIYATKVPVLYRRVCATVTYSAGATEVIFKHYQTMLEFTCWELLLIPLQQIGLVSETYERMTSTVITGDNLILRLSILFLQLEINFLS